MMRLISIAVLVVVVASETTVCSQEQKSLAADVTQPAASRPTLTERPMSIFNDQVRRFRFQIDEMLINEETVEMFMAYYRGRDPQIIGAYPDSKTNSLVVVGPPEAEHEIRLTLAKWMVERKGVYPPTLTTQKRTLKHHRKELFRELAQLDVILVQVDDEKAETIQLRHRALADELDVIEKQIQIVNSYISRLRKTNPQASVAKIVP